MLAPGQELPQEAVAQIMEMLEVVGGPPPAAAAPLPASPAAAAAAGGGSFFSGMGLSAEEREKRAREGEERAKRDAEEKKRLLAQAALNQKEREANEAMMGGVKASHAKALGTGVTVKLCVSWLRGGSTIRVHPQTPHPCTSAADGWATTLGF